MSTFTSNAAFAGAIVAATIVLNLIVLDANRSDLMAIAEQSDLCQGLHCPTDMDAPNPPAALVAAYLRCSDAASQRMLNRQEAEECATMYLRLKLSFLPDVTLKSFRELSAPQRADANRRGYRRYLTWKQQEKSRVGPMATNSGPGAVLLDDGPILRTETIRSQ